MSNDYEWYEDFPTVEIGGGNPYYKCAHCGVSVPEINYKLKGHLDFCEYRIEKERELELLKMLTQH